MYIFINIKQLFKYSLSFNNTSLGFNMILIVCDKGFFLSCIQIDFIFDKFWCSIFVTYIHTAFDYGFFSSHPISESMNTILMCHTRPSLRAESDTEDITETLRSHISYLNSTRQSRGKIIVRLLRSPLVSRGRTRTASVLCFSILPMVMSRYEFRPLQYVSTEGMLPRRKQRAKS